MAKIAIDFEWRRFADGCKLVIGKRLRKDELVIDIPPRALRVLNVDRRKPQRIVSVGKQSQTYRPLDHFPMLFGRFAREASTPEGAADFASKFGPFTARGFENGGELAAVAVAHAREMGHFLHKYEEGARALRRAVAKHSGAWMATVDVAIDFDPVTDIAQLTLKPRSLLDALWVQFGQHISTGADLRSCAHCGKWFTAGPGRGPRRDAKFCCVEHRNDFHNLKRLKRR